MEEERTRLYRAECCADCDYDEEEVFLTRREFNDLHQPGHGYCPQCGREVRFTLIEEEKE